MSNRLKVGRHLLLSCSALFPVLLAGATPASAQAVNLGGAGNLIIPDGRTQTSVTNSGSTTDIRTDTVRGQVGFNSFSQFRAGSGNTVNLHLPQNTSTLVNVVRDGPAVVEGTVNALKNGSIGGNVVFSDPYGFVLGKNGVINTGGLTINTPTKEFLDRAIDANGRIDTTLTDRLISGDVPISPNGSVVIRGPVNAETHIDIHAQSIDIDSEAKLKRHRENFEASVNTAGGVAQPSEALNRAIRFTNEYFSAGKRTEAFVALLQSLDLFRPITIESRSAGGDAQTIHGLLSVDEGKLYELSDADFLKLRDERLLAPIFAHFFSLTQIERLRDDARS